MADALDTIVSVTITRQTRTPSQAGFGIPIIVGYHDAWSDRVRSYADQDEMLEDGFTLTDENHVYLYNMVSAMKAQDPSPTEIRIGRRANATKQTVRLIPTITEAGYEYEWAVDGVTFDYTVTGSEGITGIVDGLVAGMSAAAGFTATDGTTWAICTGHTAGPIHSFYAKRGLDLLDVTGASGFTADLAAIAAEDDLNPNGPAYGWLLDLNSEAMIDALDDFLESRIALGLVQSADWDVRDAGQTGDVASGQKNSAYKRTTGIYYSQIGTHAAAALMGKELPKNPGQSTWAHKTLNGIAADSLTSGERTAINGKNWSWYATVGGVNITFEGKTPFGEYLDLVHAIDFSTARVKESIFGVLVANDKVPQTDLGIDLFRAACFSALKLCSSADFPIFDPATIIVQELTVADVPTQDRAARTLTGLKYEARLTGAFHKVVVKGRVFI